MGVERVSLFKSPVKHKFSDFRTHAGLGQERKGVNGVVNGVRGFIGICNLEE